MRARLGIDEKYIVLGVAYGWGRKKGLDVFVDLAGRLGADYRVVLVGVSEQQASQLPDRIVALPRTGSQRELAELYTAADVYVNATREEVLGLTNLEALACGTPVVTFASGGSPETIDPTCGTAVAKDDIPALCAEIVRVCTASPYSEQACVARAAQFEIRERFQDYIRLYEDASVR